jgi:hypothetical protein
MDRIAKYIPAVFILILLLVLLPANAQADKPCQECHGSSGDYTWEGLQVKALTPRVITPNTDFEHIISIEHPGGFDALGFTLILDLETADQITLMDIDRIEMDLYSSTKGTFKFNMSTGDPHPSQRIRTIINYTAEYHEDPTDYRIVLDTYLTIDKIMLSPSSWYLNLEKGDEKRIELEVMEPVKNVLIVPSDSLQSCANIKYDETESLSLGEKLTIKVKGKKAVEGKLNIIYEDMEGKPHKLTLTVVVTDTPFDWGSFWVVIGAVAGISSWILLIFSLVIGAPLRKVKIMFNKVLGAALIRKETHCWVCYALLVLALFHAVVVLANHWNGAMVWYTFILADPVMDYGLWVNLGSLTWFLMILASATGLLFRPISKYLNYRFWKWSHIILTLMAIAGSSLHGGFLFFQRLFG